MLLDCCITCINPNMHFQPQILSHNHHLPHRLQFFYFHCPKVGLRLNDIDFFDFLFFDVILNLIIRYVHIMEFSGMMTWDWMLGYILVVILGNGRSIIHTFQRLDAILPRTQLEQDNIYYNENPATGQCSRKNYNLCFIIFQVVTDSISGDCYIDHASMDYLMWWSK